MKTILNVAIIIFILFISSVVFVKYSQSKRYDFIAHYYLKTNFRRVNIAITEYAEKHSGVMPAAHNWADTINKENTLILGEDFKCPDTSYSVSYNANLADRLYSDLKGETVVVFMAIGGLNVNGGKDMFYKYSTNEKHSYLITLDGCIYRHNPSSDNFIRLHDNCMVPPDYLLWE